MTHEAGRLIAAATGAPFVMDLRDPWSVSERVYRTFASPLWLHLARHYEDRIVARAALVVANTEPFAAREAAQFPRARRVIAITNGADEEPLPPSHRLDRFSIRFAGTIYTNADPLALFRAVARVVRELALSPSEFGLDLIGDFGDDGGARIKSLATAAGIGAYTTVGAHRPRQEALDFLAQATMLVTFPGFNAMLTIPAKIFECLRFDAWLLILAPPGSAPAEALAGTSADVVAIEDEAEIARRIANRVLAHRRGERPTALAYDQRFTRRFQAGRLADALESLPARPAR
jgi:glycosyltransferase involved in cell wall biosynthesis